MAKEPVKLTEEQVSAMAEAVNLKLPPDRLAQLTERFSAFLNDFEAARSIDVGDREPATITFEEQQ